MQVSEGNDACVSFQVTRTCCLSSGVIGDSRGACGDGAASPVVSRGMFIGWNLLAMRGNVSGDRYPFAGSFARLNEVNELRRENQQIPYFRKKHVTGRNPAIGLAV